MKVLHQVEIELETPGTTVRSESVIRHVTKCTMRPGVDRLLSEKSIGHLLTVDILLYQYNSIRNPPGMLSWKNYLLDIVSITNPILLFLPQGPPAM